MRDFDLIVVGAGAAGTTAAMVAARLGLSVAVVEQRGPGGQIMTASRIENFPGFPEGIGGDDLGPRLHEQAEAAGAEVLLDTAEALAVDGDRRILTCTSETLRAPAIVVAAGSSLRALGIPGEERFYGQGVSHCASCDGPFFTGRRIGVVGGGDAALDEALVLTEHAAHVTVFHRGAAIAAQRTLLARAERSPKIDIVLQAVVEEILGEQGVTGVRVRDVRTDEVRVEPLGGVFVYVGLEPNTAFVRGVLALDSSGHIETDIMMRTSLDGVFAAGDIRAHSVALLAAAAGDGATAAVAAFRYLRAASASRR
jgi:thioredoxin reductase (NADPH)